MSVLDGAEVLPAGDAAVVLQFGDRIDPAVHDRVLAADRAVRAAGITGVEETVPSYRSLLVRLDPLTVRPGQVVAALASVVPVQDQGTSELVDIDVSFAPEDGPDLAHIATEVDTTPDAVVATLLEAQLRVYLHGFAPGFAYLGGVPDLLHLPRRATPRAPVPAGSVLLAAGQLALCPVPMPTGWWVIGRTDAVLFDATATPPVPFRPGDRVQLRECAS